MKIKWSFILVISFIGLALNVNGQQRFKKNRGERVESMKIAFLTQKMNLIPKEAAVFWPLYNERREKLEGLQREFKIKELQINGENEASAKELIYLNLSKEQTKLDLQKMYYEKFITAISARKTILLKSAEKQFKKELLREIRRRKK